MLSISSVAYQQNFFVKAIITSTPLQFNLHIIIIASFIIQSTFRNTSRIAQMKLEQKAKLLNNSPTPSAILSVPPTPIQTAARAAINNERRQKNRRE